MASVVLLEFVIAILDFFVCFLQNQSWVDLNLNPVVLVKLSFLLTERDVHFLEVQEVFLVEIGLLMDFVVHLLHVDFVWNFNSVQVSVFLDERCFLISFVLNDLVVSSKISVRVDIEAFAVFQEERLSELRGKLHKGSFD